MGEHFNWFAPASIEILLRVEFLVNHCKPHVSNLPSTQKKEAMILQGVRSVVGHLSLLFSKFTPPWKLAWHWKIPIVNRKYTSKRLCFHCHVGFAGGVHVEKSHNMWPQLGDFATNAGHKRKISRVVAWGQGVGFGFPPKKQTQMLNVWPIYLHENHKFRPFSPFM